MSHVNELLDISSAPLGVAQVSGHLTDMIPSGVGGKRLLCEYEELLLSRNGFYAFDRWLHVFPLGNARDGGYSVELWNLPDAWIEFYGDLAEGLFFFAEDIFGNQFAIDRELVVLFEAETGDREPIARSLDDWAQEVLSDAPSLTGRSLASAWADVNGSLSPEMHLVPVTPFVVGGAYDIANLRPIDAVKSMRFRGDIATQIRDLPDGTQISLKLVD